MNFYELLIIFSTIFFVIILVILIKRKNESLIDIKPKYNFTNFNIFYILFIILILYTGYSLIIGIRDITWFVIFSAYIILSLLYASSKNISIRNFATVSILLLSIVISITPLIENRGIIFGPDQWRDLGITSFIVEKGTFQGSGSSGYYSIPLFNVINSVVTIATGWQPMTTFLVMGISYAIITTFSIYLLTLKLTSNRETAFIALAIMLSIPRLSTTQVIPAEASLALGLLLLVLLFDEIIQRKAFYLTPLILALTFVIHPTGVVPVACVMAGILILKMLYHEDKFLVENSAHIKKTLFSSVILAIGYLSISSSARARIISTTGSLISTLLSTRRFSSTYIPLTTGENTLLTSYVWALPVSICGAFFIMFLFYYRGKEELRKEPAVAYGGAATFFALGLIFLAFISILLVPGASLERYLSVPAYALMLVPSAFVLNRLFSDKAKVVTTLAILLIAVNVFIGTSSPSWAPFENPGFGTFQSTYSGYLEAQRIVTTLPPAVHVYEDNDIPIAEVANVQHGLNVTKDISYQTIRQTISDLKINVINYKQKGLQDGVVYLKTDEIKNQQLYQRPVDIIYSSGAHTGLRLSGFG